ncbi:hypothetical protein phytr_1780 [Candidatus Phycorickettsia trachydisci]|uniref:DUF2335 domain-containing protein n=1 Tax=Candidatus Phycorickettsia trachydisci TaxID=2115978 RepID=A0A2P1P7A4_9RICK|nr:DUF2335 domain-containing protein [Candidatus Phycorickettsia trachydisci]AVP87136.1 hypothetical protein phytr_1780 [Candidatus Phycorickettsia trachydisci]
MSREVKHFFVEDNHLNKITPNLNHSYMHKVRNEFEGLMPPPEVLHAYEEIMPGTVEKLLGLMEQEQKHKHAMERAKIFMHSKTETIGKMFASFTIIIIAYATIVLSKKSLGHSLVFAAIAFTSIFAVSLVAYFRTTPVPKVAPEPVKKHEEIKVHQEPKPHWNQERQTKKRRTIRKRK